MPARNGGSRMSSQEGGSSQGSSSSQGGRPVRSDEATSSPGLVSPGSDRGTTSVPTRRWEMTSQEQDMMDRFRRDFLDLLDGRVAKIEKLVQTAQLEPAHVALLSLESSSAMIGRSELVAAVRQLRQALTQAAPDKLDALLARVLEQAETARRELESSGS